MLEQGQKAGFLDQQYLGRLDGPGIGRITREGGQGGFGKGFAGPKNMDDLFFARGADAMNVYCSLLHNLKTMRGIPFAKQIITPVQGFDHGDFGDAVEVRRRKAGKKLASTQGIDNGRLFEFRE